MTLAGANENEPTRSNPGQQSTACRAKGRQCPDKLRCSHAGARARYLEGARELDRSVALGMKNAHKCADMVSSAPLPRGQAGSQSKLLRCWRACSRSECIGQTWIHRHLFLDCASSPETASAIESSEAPMRLPQRASDLSRRTCINNGTTIAFNLLRQYAHLCGGAPLCPTVMSVLGSRGRVAGNVDLLPLTIHETRPFAWRINRDGEDNTSPGIVISKSEPCHEQAQPSVGNAGASGITWRPRAVLVAQHHDSPASDHYAVEGAVDHEPNAGSIARAGFMQGRR
jgi:hypothetical protein